VPTLLLLQIDLLLTLIENEEYSQLSEYIDHVRRSCLIRPENANFIFRRFGVKMKRLMERGRMFMAFRRSRLYHAQGAGQSIASMDSIQNPLGVD
jgi:hypothetical protein